MEMTVYFDGTFWAALLEWQSRGVYYACPYVFGKEPKDADIWDFIHRDLQGLVRKQERLLEQTSSSAIFPNEKRRKTNPKRMQRDIAKARKKPVLSTKAQLEMQKAHELLKLERKKARKDKREKEKASQFAIRQEKRHQKHKGH